MRAPSAHRTHSSVAAGQGLSPTLPVGSIGGVETLSEEPPCIGFVQGFYLWTSPLGFLGGAYTHSGMLLHQYVQSIWDSWPVCAGHKSGRLLRAISRRTCSGGAPRSRLRSSLPGCVFREGWLGRTVCECCTLVARSSAAAAGQGPVLGLGRFIASRCLALSDMFL